MRTITPGEVMQLPAGDEIVLVSGAPPIRAKKVRYYEDAQLKSRILRPPSLASAGEDTLGDRAAPRTDDWSRLALPDRGALAKDGSVADLFSEDEDDPENAGIRREPTLPKHEAIAPEQPTPAREFAVFEDEPGARL